MKRLIVLSTILSLGFAASAFACDGSKVPPQKDTTAPQTQSETKTDKSASAPVKNAGSEQASSATAK